MRLDGEAAPVLEPVQEPVAAAEPLSGPEVYDKACQTCHGPGIAGSPIYGDVAEWAPRIEQGLDVLRRHAVEGYVGDAGVMPAKGGFMDLSDQEVYDAVDYMIAGSQE